MIWLFILCLVSLPAGFTSLVRLPYQAYNCCLLGLPARVSGWLFSVSAVFLIDNTKVRKNAEARKFSVQNPPFLRGISRPNFHEKSEVAPARVLLPDTTHLFGARTGQMDYGLWTFW